MANWHYQKNGEQHGPVSGNQLKQLAAAGDLQPSDLIRKEGTTDWVVAEKLKGLFSVTSSQSPTQSPPDLPVAPDAAPASVLRSRTNGRSKVLLIIGSVGGAVLLTTVIVVAVLLAVSGNGGESNDSADDPPTRTDQIWAAELRRQFTANPEQAEADFRGKTIVVVGIAGTSGEFQINGNPVSFRDFRNVRVRCHFSGNPASGNGRRGEWIVVRGRCQGLNQRDARYVLIENCQLVASQKPPPPSAESHSAFSNRTPAYQKGYREFWDVGMRMASEYNVAKSEAQRKFFLNQVRSSQAGFENSRDQIIRQHGAESEAAQRYLGICDGYSDAWKMGLQLGQSR